METDTSFKKKFEIILFSKKKTWNLFSLVSIKRKEKDHYMQFTHWT